MKMTIFNRLVSKTSRSHDTDSRDWEILGHFMLMKEKSENSNKKVGDAFNIARFVPFWQNTEVEGSPLKNWITHY